MTPHSDERLLAQLLIQNHLAFLAAHRGRVTAIADGFDCCSERARFNMTFVLSADSARAAAARSRTLYVPSWIHSEASSFLADRFDESYSLAYMAREIASSKDGTKLPHAPDLEVRYARSAAAIDEFADVQAGGFCETPESLAEFGDWMRAADQRNADSLTQRFYVGYLSGTPVTCALLLDCASIAGVYAVATLPAFRRRGFSRITLLIALSEARARGFGISGLQVVMGSPAEQVYLNLGYRAVFRMHVLEAKSPA